MTTFVDLLTTIQQVRTATLIHVAAERDPEIKAGMEINLDLLTRALNDAGWPVETAARCSCNHANWQHAREGDARLEAEDFEIGQCYVKDCGCTDYDGPERQ